VGTSLFIRDIYGDLDGKRPLKGPFVGKELGDVSQTGDQPKISERHYVCWSVWGPRNSFYVELEITWEAPWG
jgi:hypothetical protein